MEVRIVEHRDAAVLGEAIEQMRAAPLVQRCVRGIAGADSVRSRRRDRNSEWLGSRGVAGPESLNGRVAEKREPPRKRK